MSMFGGLKSCVFSDVTLRLLWQGQPLKNAKVTRSWEWGKEKSDEAVTDENGVARFPAVYEPSISRLLPVEFVVGQQLAVLVNDEEKVIWTNSKREAADKAEYGGKDFVVTCELMDEEVLIEDYGSLMVTMCKLEK